jgi:hypothetical protein
VKLAVPVSSVSSFDYWIRTDRNWDWHQRPTGIRRIADIGTLLALHAPRPLVVVSSKRGTDDEEFPLDEAEKSFQWAKQVYDLLDADNSAMHYESTTGHGYQEDKRQQLYGAVERWLRPPFAQGETELPVTLESFEDLRCGLPEGNRTVRDIYDEWLKPLPRPSRPGDAMALRSFLSERLGWPQPLPDVNAQKVAEDKKGPWSVEFWIFEPEAGIRLPAMRISGKSAAAPITLVPGRDKGAVARALAAGGQVVVFDLRGTGEIGEPEGSMKNWAWFAGRPMSGQWALDLIQAARLCRDKFSAAAISVDAENAFGWPALLAGAAAPEFIASGKVQIPLASLHDDIAERGDRALADVPGLLERLDIPQLRVLWPDGQVSVKR